jgi:hypothetical protein
MTIVIDEKISILPARSGRGSYIEASAPHAFELGREEACCRKTGIAWGYICLDISPPNLANRDPHSLRTL